MDNFWSELNHLPNWWTIIMFIGLTIWNIAVLVRDIKSMKVRLSDYDAKWNKLEKCNLQHEVEMNVKLEQLKEWSRHKMEEQSDSNDERYVSTERYEANIREIRQRLERIENKIDKIYEVKRGN